jgi:hypothetical protein
LARCGAISSVCPFSLVILQDGDLASSKNGFEGKADEELGGGREECADGIGGWCEDGVDAEGRAEEEGR